MSQFDEENEMTRRQIDLILFLDGYEKSGKAIENTQEAFRKSWKRPKWNIIFQEKLCDDQETGQRLRQFP